MSILLMSSNVIQSSLESSYRTRYSASLELYHIISPVCQSFLVLDACSYKNLSNRKVPYGFHF